MSRTFLNNRVILRRIVLLLAVSSLAVCRSAAEDLHPAPGEPLAVEDQITLDNGRLRVGVSAELGRVVDLGLSGGRNLLWMNGQAAGGEATQGDETRRKHYVNWGGDKIWPTPQIMWERATGNALWPPDGVLDGGAWSVTRHSDRSLTMESQQSPHYGIIIKRQVDLDTTEARVLITNTIRRVSRNPFPVHIWSVTQVLPPRLVLLNIEPQRPMQQPLVQMLSKNTSERLKDHLDINPQRDVVTWRIGPDHALKIGTFGNWIAAVYDEVVFLQSSQLDPDGAYPDLSSMQCYLGEGYVELETLSPLVQLAEGEETTNRVEWRLVPVGDDFELDAWVDQQQKQVE